MEGVGSGNIVLTESPLGPDRAPFSGSWDQIVDDAAGCRAEGADELVLDLFMSARDGDEEIDLSLEAMTSSELRALPTDPRIGIRRSLGSSRDIWEKLKDSSMSSNRAPDSFSQGKHVGPVRLLIRA